MRIEERYDRSIRLFGSEGQKKLAATRAVIVGVSGLGTPLVQHLALLGVGELSLVEPEELDTTNRNRFIGARISDPVPGSRKVFLAHRLISETNPDVRVITIPHTLVSPIAFAAIKEADWVFGCLDDDGPRYVLNELCSAYSKPYIDLASDVPEPGVYGGHVFVNVRGDGCLSCCDLLDEKAFTTYVSTPEDRAVRDKIYGVPIEALADNKGPSVSPINGVIAAVAAVEFMVAVTGMRNPKKMFNYRAFQGRLLNDDTPGRKANCQFCEKIRGKPDAADVDRYLQMPHLRRI
jgi:molybdopterin-synthase adenylyltransferase